MKIDLQSCRAALLLFTCVILGCRAGTMTADDGGGEDYGRPTIFARGQGEQRLMRGTRPLFILADPVTVGSRSLVAGYEDVPPGDSGKTHQHEQEDEMLFIFRGEIDVLLGDSVHRASAGSSVFIPRRTWVGFHNTSADTAGFFFVFNTPTFEQCLRGLSSRPGEVYIAPAGTDLRRLGEHCHWVVKAD